LTEKDLIQYHIDTIKRESDTTKNRRRMDATKAAEERSRQAAKERARQAAEERARQAAEEAARHTIFGRIRGLFSPPKGGKTKRRRSSSNKRMRKNKRKTARR
jgi:membrane protein involved in colicin uptake